jgi:hypothetical protein
VQRPAAYHFFSLLLSSEAYKAGSSMESPKTFQKSSKRLRRTIATTSKESEKHLRTLETRQKVGEAWGC